MISHMCRLRSHGELCPAIVGLAGIDDFSRACGAWVAIRPIATFIIGARPRGIAIGPT